MNKKKSQRRDKHYLYKRWHAMKYHCYNPNSTHYQSYRQLGIEVYPEWIPNKEGFDCYRDWILDNLGKRPHKDAIVKRIDSNGSFVPGNLMWSNMRELSNTRRTNFMITYKRKTLSLSAWCRKLNIPYDRTWNRLVDYHWTVKEAFEQ